MTTLKGFDQAAHIFRQLETAGAKIYVRLPTAGGTRQADLPFDQIEQFLAHPEQVRAGLSGVTLEEMEEWDRWDHMPRCGARTIKGDLCRHGLSGDRDPAEFVALHRQEYCSTHSE